MSEKAHVHDIHATILHLLGMDHEKLTYRHNGRDERLTDVAGFVIETFGVIPTLTGIAAAYLVVTATIFINPAMREMDRRRVEPPAASA